ncbi:glutamine-hydrolyzing carbamoyl-phosphate synthase small subunit [Buchnera aphidicola]|uniref:Carbamoyl phosphate synthase small chain n=1 Tax=Buchnera aphidicola (Sarucallis kahawaluokalani) TaxID=1241878 RepID=A0A4D6YCK6_9GAMM|nr:glutamine-hydrolyzing carbamoyl-phosphate synthase small subunit [Buchnera aphidicola]QCI25903.1 carbamoyl-phosphate synthase small subunit [Buchnera aphidicola (Sarucallis kahawaluokalani)]
MKESAFLVLEDGTLFEGVSIGITGMTTGEIVFNTAMTGYQEILTDPSYANQIITFTYPHIGNTGINQTDCESEKIQIKGIIMHDISLIHSSYRSNMNLEKYLKNNNIIGIMNIDTRKLTKIIRNKGTQYGCIFTDKTTNINTIYKRINNAINQSKINIITDISTKKIYHWNKGTKNIYTGKYNQCIKKLPFHVIVYDFGVKKNILRILVDYGCYLTVVPENTSAEKIISLNPDGILLSNGPGDPRLCINNINNIKILLNTMIPIFGICLGHQLLAIANQAKILKMKFGHHGSNHPVQNIKTKKVFITTQNHNFTIDKNFLPKNIEITHQSLFDKTIQGIKIIHKNVFGFQGHPEANPGPHDAEELFKKFIKNIKKYKKNQYRN